MNWDAYFSTYWAIPPWMERRNAGGDGTLRFLDPGSLGLSSRARKILNRLIHDGYNTGSPSSPEIVYKGATHFRDLDGLRSSQLCMMQGCGPQTAFELISWLESQGSRVVRDGVV
jgi:hypothetical protein